MSIKIYKLDIFDNRPYAVLQIAKFSRNKIYIMGETENYVYYLVMQIEWKFDQKMKCCDLFQYIFIISLVSNERKTISQGGGSNYFHLYFLLSYCDVWYGGTNLVNWLFGVKILNFNFLKIGLTNDFDSFCMHLWVNPTTWTHIRFPWSIKINLCHVLERCEGQLDFPP